jgi:hypothetical protein
VPAGSGTGIYRDAGAGGFFHDDMCVRVCVAEAAVWLDGGRVLELICRARTLLASAESEPVPMPMPMLVLRCLNSVIQLWFHHAEVSRTTPVSRRSCARRRDATVKLDGGGWWWNADQTVQEMISNTHLD